MHQKSENKTLVSSLWLPWWI